MKATGAVGQATAPARWGIPSFSAPDGADASRAALEDQLAEVAQPSVQSPGASATLKYVDRLAGKRAHSRSQVIQSFTDESRRRTNEERLARLASEFFARELTPEEAEERDDWLRMSAEAQKRDR